MKKKERDRNDRMRQKHPQRTIIKELDSMNQCEGT